MKKILIVFFCFFSFYMFFSIPLFSTVAKDPQWGVGPTHNSLEIIPIPGYEGKYEPNGSISVYRPHNSPINETTLVILVHFSQAGNARVTANTPTYYNNLLFTTGTNSMADYYKEVSYDNIAIPGTIAGNKWYTSTRTMEYYGQDSNPWVSIDNANVPIYELAKEALNLADADVNFAAYDTNPTDGFITPNELHIIIVHAGSDQAAGVVYNDYWRIWSHRWNTGSWQLHDGVNLLYYTMLAEDSPMGTYAHEFGHDLSLPDLYDINTANGSSEGVGEWSLMGSGNWLNNGANPAHLSAWEKCNKGWVVPTIITSDINGYSLPQVETNQSILKVWARNPSTSTEYFLIENRSKTSGNFDNYIPGEGLMVWHVDETIPNNGDETHKKVDLEEADGLYQLDIGAGITELGVTGNRGDSGDPFKSPSATAFNHCTNPNSYSYVNINNFSLSNIGLPGLAMTFDIKVKPKITLTSPSAGLTCATSATIAGTVDDRSISPAVVSIYINGLLNTTAPLTLGSCPNEATFSIPLTLVNGSNKIEVRATDAAGYEGSSGVVNVISSQLCDSLNWLREQQDPTNGSWKYSDGFSAFTHPGGSFYGVSPDDESSALTGLAITAMLNAGYDLNDPIVSKGLDYLISLASISVNGELAPGYAENYETSGALTGLIAARKKYFETGTAPFVKGAINVDTIIDNGFKYILKSQCLEPTYDTIGAAVDGFTGYTAASAYYGGWGYPHRGARQNWADLSNAQFALIALVAVSESSKINSLNGATYDWRNGTTTVPGINLAGRKAAAEIFVKKCQQTTLNNTSMACSKIPTQLDNGYNYQPCGVPGGGDPDHWAAGNSYGSMTTAGVWSLWCLNIPLVDSAVSQGINWLNTFYNPATLGKLPVNGSLTVGLPDDQFLHYYFYTLAKALVMYPTPILNASNWYNDIKSYLFSTQVHPATGYGYWRQTGSTPDDPEYAIWATIASMLAIQMKEKAPLSVLEITLQSPGDLRVFDENGNVTDKDHANIPGSSFINTPHQKISITEPVGNYKMEVWGVATGSYTLSVEGLLGGNSVYSNSATHNISAGQIDIHNVVISKLIGPMTVFDDLNNPPIEPTPTNTPSITPTFTVTPTFTLTYTITPTFTPQYTVMLKFKSGDTNPSTNSPHQQVQIYNQGIPIDLSQMEIRYWYKYEGSGQGEQAIVDYAGKMVAGIAITNNSHPSIVTGSFDAGQDRYLKVTFDSGAGILNSDDFVQVESRFNKTDWSSYDQGNDWSFYSVNDYTPWNKITVYMNGILIYGQEPGPLPTSTITPTLTDTGTFTITPTISPTGTITETFVDTATYTDTATPTVTMTRTESYTTTGTHTMTTTASITPTITATRTTTWTATPAPTSTTHKLNLLVRNNGGDTCSSTNVFNYDVKIVNFDNVGININTLTVKMWFYTASDNINNNGAYGGTIYNSSGQWQSNASMNMNISNSSPNPACTAVNDRKTNRTATLSFTTSYDIPANGGYADSLDGQLYRGSWASPFDNNCDDYSKLGSGSYHNDVYFALYENGVLVSEWTSASSQDSNTGVEPCVAQASPTNTQVINPTDTATMAPTPTVTPTSSASGVARVQYRIESQGDNTISILARIYNDGTGNLDLSSVSAKYWYTFEGTSQTEIVENDDTRKQPSGTDIKAYTNTGISTINQGNQTRVEVTSFVSGAGSIASNEYVEYHLRIHKNDWSDYDKINDYSAGTQTEFQNWSKITAYVGGSKIWGTEPGEMGLLSLSKYTPTPNIVEPLRSSNTYNYPNPSSGITHIRFSLAKPVDVNINIYDMAGKPVWKKDINKSETRARVNTITWDGINDFGLDVSNGIYILKISADGITVTKKIAIVR